MDKTDISISQELADALMQMGKFAVSGEEQRIPICGGVLNIPLFSIDRHEAFILDIRKSERKTIKCSLQNRARSTIVLARLDLHASPHTNPDGTRVGGNHLHLYSDKFGDKVANELPPQLLANGDGTYETLLCFMDYCNIIYKPNIPQELFI